MATVAGSLTRVGRGTRTAVKNARRYPIISITIIGLFAFCAIFADLVVPHDPLEQDLRGRLAPPAWQEGGSSDHLLGTDDFGRDILSRLIMGARISLTVAIAALAVSAAIGVSMGLASGYFGGRVDAILMRLVDANIALPGLLFALILAVTLGAGYGTVIVAIGIVSWSRIARMMRAEALMIKSRDYVRAARVSGASNLRILVVHVFPNAFNTLLVLLTLSIGGVILFEASLSFLGAGVPPPDPSWGAMTAGGRDYITTHWWMALLPGAAITLVVFAFNFFGDWVRDRLDPRLRQV